MRSDPPLILAFDTSAAHCAAALLRGEAVLASRAEAMARGQAERLLPMLGEVLAEAGADWSGLAALAVCCGPGNFTGLRIGVATARGLALALARPAIGVTRFEALAAGVPGTVLVTIEATGAGVYAQLLRDGAAAAEPSLVPLDAVAAPAGALVIGHGAAALAARLGGTAGPEDTLPDPAAIGRVALGRLGRGACRPAPLYLRPPDARPVAGAAPLFAP